MSGCFKHGTRGGNAARSTAWALPNRLALLFTMSAAAALATMPAAAQTFPVRPVRFIVPAPPGSAPDVIARVLGARLAESWGQPTVVDNILGAGGNIGTDRVAKSAPDGHTLLVNTIGPIAVNVSLFDKLPFDPAKDFAPITLIAKVPNILCVHPSVPARSVAELVAHARQNPGRLRYGSAGSGTTPHLSFELLGGIAGVQFVHIPYKSSAQMTTDAIGGQVEMIFHNTTVALPHVKTGALRGLAISSTTRSVLAPDLPTMIEAGIPDYEVTAWFGLLAPAGTPAATIAKINADVLRLLANPEVRERFQGLGAEVIGNSPQEFAVFIQAETAKWRKVVRQSGAKAD